MTPDLLVRIGGLTEFPPAPKEFQPEGAWVQKYRIHTCHGYVESSNEDAGVLRVERVPGGAGKSFTLKFQQRIVNDEGDVNYVDADVTCQPDRLASPVEWKLSSRFEDVAGKPIAGLDAAESGRLAGGAVTITRGGHRLQHRSSRPVTADWCLFEAVQRLRFAPPDPAPFDLLEGLSLVRENHHIAYRGLYQMKEKKWPPMHWFHQLGHGLLPYEYWLDDRHRLLVAAMGARAYILDDKADARVAATQQQIRERKNRRRNG